MDLPGTGITWDILCLKHQCAYTPVQVAPTVGTDVCLYHDSCRLLFFADKNLGSRIYFWSRELDVKEQMP